MTRTEAVGFLLAQPHKYGHLLGFTRLNELNGRWIADMVRGTEDTTLQGHRGSYKTTCLSIALAEVVILLPNLKILFMRKTDADVKEIVAQVKKILQHPATLYLVRAIYGADLFVTASNATEISTNLCSDPRGAAQIVALGTGGSLTGKHFDRIYTDDIVNLQDRISRAERERTKIIYQELQNIKNRGGRIYNTGTPWHKDDCFTLMPNAKRYDCYSTGIMSEDEIAAVRCGMAPSLFAANYELKHISDEEMIFSSPRVGADPALAEQGDCHIDAAYGGSDYTAFTICRRQGGKYYIYGRLWPKHVDDCKADIITLRKQFNAGKIYCEDNGDKGYLAKELRSLGERVVTYHETTNKYIKITSYLKAVWGDVYFVEGTDPLYIDQICDYNEHADHDDAPDSAASLIRKLYKPQQDYTPLWM